MPDGPVSSPSILASSSWRWRSPYGGRRAPPSPSCLIDMLCRGGAYKCPVELRKKNFDVEIEEVQSNITIGAGVGDLAMRALLFVSVMGAALYALLVVTHNVLPAYNEERPSWSNSAL